MGVQELKKRIDILDVLEESGARFEMWQVYGKNPGWDDEVCVFCPFCEDRDSRKPAGRANILKQLYFCFNCGAGGDVISVAQRHLTSEEGLAPPFSTVVSWLQETFGVEDER